MSGAIKERRRFPRKNLQIPVQYKSLKLSEDNFSGALTRNIAEGGVRFVGNDFISLSDRLILTIILPAPFHSIKVISKVIWIQRVRVGDRYEIGNQFLDLSEDDKKHLQDCIKKNPHLIRLLS